MGVPLETSSISNAGIFHYCSQPAIGLPPRLRKPSHGEFEKSTSSWAPWTFGARSKSTDRSAVLWRGWRRCAAAGAGSNICWMRCRRWAEMDGKWMMKGRICRKPHDIHQNWKIESGNWCLKWQKPGSFLPFVPVNHPRSDGLGPEIESWWWFVALPILPTLPLTQAVTVQQNVLSYNLACHLPADGWLRTWQRKTSTFPRKNRPETSINSGFRWISIAKLKSPKESKGRSQQIQDVQSHHPIIY